MVIVQYTTIYSIQQYIDIIRIDYTISCIVYSYFNKGIRMIDNQERKEIKDIFIGKIALTLSDIINNDLNKYNISDKMKNDIKQNISVCVNLVLNITL